jgi:hypothetical protein
LRGLAKLEFSAFIVFPIKISLVQSFQLIGPSSFLPSSLPFYDFLLLFFFGQRMQRFRGIW